MSTRPAKTTISAKYVRAEKGSFESIRSQTLTGSITNVGKLQVSGTTTLGSSAEIKGDLTVQKSSGDTRIDVFSLNFIVEEFDEGLLDVFCRFNLNNKRSLF